ncbi:MAG TPA: hypothetical protein VHE61_19560 [Opitutaceae bacterium]|nr:hypothetical protein [Opitutaceae bacterium]
MRRLRHLFPLFVLLLSGVSAASAASPFAGRWRLDRSRSSALDGWSAWDLVISVEGTRVNLRHDMQWNATRFSATNVVDTAHPVMLPHFFRVEQRHMALYPAKGESTPVTAAWIDGGRTLRMEAEEPVEISQGHATLRIYSEYRLLDGDRELLLIELHSSRPRPLVYRFIRVDGKD